MMLTKPDLSENLQTQRDISKSISTNLLKTLLETVKKTQKNRKAENPMTRNRNLEGRIILLVSDNGMYI